MSNNSNNSIDPIASKRGFLEVSLMAARDNPSLMLRIQSDMAVSDVSINHATDTFRIYGASPQFDSIEGHQIAPAYDWHLAPNGAITYKRRQA